MDKIRREEAGMTLLELMFACGIAATALSLIFGSLISISVVGRINESRSAAVTALDSVMEEIRSIPYGELLTYFPPDDIEGPGTHRVVEVACLIPGGGENEGESYSRIPLPLEEGTQPILPNPIEVEVTLTWQEDSGHTFQVKASTLKGR